MPARNRRWEDRRAQDRVQGGWIRHGGQFLAIDGRRLGKAKALALAEGYVAPQPELIALAGPSGACAIGNALDSEALAGRITAHDRVIGLAIVNVLTGGPAADPLKPLTEDAVIALEREAFVDLLATPSSLDRIRHMLTTGKPLRN